MSTTLQILAAFGIGSIVSAFVIFIARLIFNKIYGNHKSEQEFVKIMRSSMQAMLRVEIRREYNEYYVKQKYIPMAEKSDFDYIWKCYHSLGKNGVMDDCYEKVMDLPTSKPQKGGKHNNG